MEREPAGRRSSRSRSAYTGSGPGRSQAAGVRPHRPIVGTAGGEVRPRVRWPPRPGRGAVDRVLVQDRAVRPGHRRPAAGPPGDAAARGRWPIPSARLSGLPVLTEAELRCELAEWNDTAAPVAAALHARGVRGPGGAAPGAVAAQFGAQRWSLRGAEPAANQIARRLRGRAWAPRPWSGWACPSGLTAAGRAAGHLEGRRRLRAAGPGAARGAAGVHDRRHRDAGADRRRRRAPPAGPRRSPWSRWTPSGSRSPAWTRR